MSKLLKKETVDRLPKLIPEKREDVAVLAESGDVDDIDASDGDDGLSAVLRRRSDCLGFNGLIAEGMAVDERALCRRVLMLRFFRTSLVYHLICSDLMFVATAFLQ